MDTKVWLLVLLIFVPKLSNGQDCNVAAIDLVFLLDVSGSVTLANFQNVLVFVRDVVSTLDIGPNAGQVAVITFDDSTNVVFSLTAHNNEPALLAAISAVPYDGGGTNIAAGLNRLVSDGFTGARPPSQGVPRFAVVVTDGQSNLAAVQTAASALRAVVPAITCYAIGIGTGIETAQLEAIASTPTSTFLRTITNFSPAELATVTQTLLQQACQAVVTLAIGEKIQRGIGAGQLAFFQYQVPAQGFTIQLTVGMGQIAICGSTTIERPSCSDSSLHDWRREVTAFADIYITPDGLDADSLRAGRPLPMPLPTNVQMFVTVEGLDMSNDLQCLNTTFGDTRIPRGMDGMGDDPHFSIALPSGELLCYTVQGEHGFVFNLISNKKVQMNAMFVPDSRREEVTWLGSMGIVVQNSQYKLSNATYLRFETKGKKIYIGDKVALEARKIEKLIFVKGKLTISETPPFEGFRYPSVVVDLQDVGLNFTIKFMGEHLDLFWHNTGIHTQDSHGLIGQFFRKEVEIDTVRKFLILPGKEPVPVMRHPVWSFMEREVVDDQLCWTAMNPGYQGEGLIDGKYIDYLVNDVLSTDFKFKKQ